jgi:hypothetical protein
LAAFWGSELHDAGYAGDIGEMPSGWPEGRDLLSRLTNTTRSQIDHHYASLEASAMSLFA